MYAGLQFLKFGVGGDRKIEDFTDMDVYTVARGRRELFTQNIATDRDRNLMKYETAGYPIVPATTIFINTMLKLLPPLGGICLQGEGEISSVGFLLLPGAWVCPWPV